MAPRAQGASLALDWFATASRSLDALEQRETQTQEARRKFRSELHAAQADDSKAGSAERDELEGKQDQSRVELPTEIISARAIPRRAQLLRALEAIQKSSEERIRQSEGPSAAPPSPSADTTPLYRVTLATYALALDTLFDEADRLQDSTWYWNQIQDSHWAATTYLVQTLPWRLAHLAKESYRILLEITQSPTSDSSDASLRSQSHVRIDRASLVATARRLRKTPDVVVGALWPHSIAAIDNADGSDAPVTASALQQDTRRRPGGRALAGPLLLLKRAKRLSPLTLTVHEAQTKAQLLAERRAQVARQLGSLALIALDLTEASSGQSISAEAADQQCSRLARTLHETLLGQENSASGQTTSSVHSLLEQVLSSPQLSQSATDRLQTAPIGLSPPSRLSLVWPRLIFYPAMILISIRLASRNRDALKEAAMNARETAKGFFRNWIVQPLSELLDTIRGGDAQSRGSETDGGSIVTKEGRKADLESLERMVTQYAVEKGQISADDVVRREALRRKVREGDLDVVMLAYEDQLKSPLKSLTLGSLPRLLLIQVQKAKYDLAVAMSGIDHLLKSQALLFGAVGIAPAMGILWASFKAGQWLVRGRVGENEQDQKRQRQRAWASMRRVDRMLTNGKAELSPHAYGSLLLELAALRRVGTSVISSSSRGSGSSRRRRRKHSSSSSAGAACDIGSSGDGDDDCVSAYLQDIRDLERIAANACNGGAGSNHKSSAVDSSQAAVERLWRCWGSSLFVLPIGLAR
ncbi:unnamed protein product [Parajaminaea phylloscopi]